MLFILIASINGVINVVLESKTLMLCPSSTRYRITSRLPTRTAVCRSVLPQWPCLLSRALTTVSRGKDSLNWMKSSGLLVSRYSKRCSRCAATISLYENIVKTWFILIFQLYPKCDVISQALIETQYTTSPSITHYTVFIPGYSCVVSSSRLLHTVICCHISRRGF